MIPGIVPRTLVVCFALGIYSVSVLAQTSDTRPRVIKQTAQIGESYVADDNRTIVSVAENGTARAVEESKPGKSLLTSSTIALARYQPLLSAAIDQRLGSPYHWGSTGPNSFDCSGFVWSTFHTAGIEFERGSARTLWARFEAPAPEDKMKFGTLVFFSGQTHVGIVVDEHGFYHASRHHGVVYALFDKYWLARIDGFRRVPLPVATPTAAPVATLQAVQDK